MNGISDAAAEAVGMMLHRAEADARLLQQQRALAARNPGVSDVAAEGVGWMFSQEAREQHLETQRRLESERRLNYDEEGLNAAHRLFRRSNAEHQRAERRRRNNQNAILKAQAAKEEREREKAKRGEEKKAREGDMRLAQERLMNLQQVRDQLLLRAAEVGETDLLAPITEQLVAFRRAVYFGKLDLYDMTAIYSELSDWLGRTAELLEELVSAARHIDWGSPSSSASDNRSKALDFLKLAERDESNMLGFHYCCTQLKCEQQPPPSTSGHKHSRNHLEFEEAKDDIMASLELWKKKKRSSPRVVGGRYDAALVDDPWRVACVTQAVCDQLAGWWTAKTGKGNIIEASVRRSDSAYWGFHATRRVEGDKSNHINYHLNKCS